MQFNRGGWYSSLPDVRDSQARASLPSIPGELLPVYPLNRRVEPDAYHPQPHLAEPLKEWLGGIEEYLPPALLARSRLMPLSEAIRQAHYPDDLGKWASARRRLAFDELLTLATFGAGPPAARQSTGRGNIRRRRCRPGGRFYSFTPLFFNRRSKAMPRGNPGRLETAERRQ